MWDHLLDLIEQIPASFWGIVVGSFFSLGGVMLSNKASEQRLVQQFDHERKIKNKDREMALKKEVYLETADAISAGINAITRFPNLDIPNNDVTGEFISKSPAISKTHVIASAKTIEALSRFLGELDKAFLMLWAKRNEITNKKTATTILANQIASFEKVQNEMLEKIRECNIDGVTDKRKFDILEQNFKFEQERIKEAANKNTAISIELYQKTLEFMRECIIETHKLRRLITPVLSAVREELCLPFDSLSYTQILEEEMKKQLEAIEQGIVKFQEQGIKQSLDEIIQHLEIKPFLS